MLNFTNIINALNSPVRQIIAEVELYQGSTLVKTFKYNDKLVDFTVERVAEESKFFGFGICQHIKVSILDSNREIDYIDTSYSLRVKMGIPSLMAYVFAKEFNVTQTTRDENTNMLHIYGYDAINKASQIKATEIAYTGTQTVRNIALKCARALGVTLNILNTGNSTCFNTPIPEGLNLDGSETLRDILDDIAEVTQTVYFINNSGYIVFARLNKDAAPVYTIDKSKYFTLESKPNKKLTKITHITSLNDNLYAETGESGTTQNVRENSIWTQTPDLEVLLQDAINEVGGFTMAQFDCNWRGNFLLEPGDKIGLITKDNEVINSYVLSDIIEYNGALKQRTKWTYSEEADEEGGNPATLGEVVRQTYAKVDKAAGQIDLVARKTEELSDKVASITIDAEAITSVVQRVDKLEDDVETHESRIDQTADELALKVSKDDIISAINLSPENIVISSQKIDMEGVVTFTDLETAGATVINGSNITTGTIEAERINLTGAITFEDLDSDTQERFEDTEYTAKEAFHLALQAGNGVTLPGYIKSSYIDSAEIRSPTITGNEIQVYNTFQAIGYDGSNEVVSGYMGAARGMDINGQTTFGVALSNEWSSDSYNVGDNYVIVTNGGVRLQAGTNSITVTSGAINITANNGRAYYNGVEINTGGGSTATVVPVWG